MASIVLFGGTSEIGVKVAELLVNRLSCYNEIKYVSHSLPPSKNVWSWEPESYKDVDAIFNDIKLAQGDLVILALGYLGEKYTLDDLDYNVFDIEKVLTVNFNITLLTMLRAGSELSKAGGGKILVMTSSAAYPVLDTNLFYGSMKLCLDQIANRMAKLYSRFDVSLTVVRSGFVPTKLNFGRKPTPFSKSADEVASVILKHFDSNVIWTPTFFKYVSGSLMYIPLLKRIANARVRKSWNP
jgi:short-subunit dehydrogenase